MPTAPVDTRERMDFRPRQCKYGRTRPPPHEIQVRPAPFPTRKHRPENRKIRSLIVAAFQRNDDTAITTNSAGNHGLAVAACSPADEPVCLPENVHAAIDKNPSTLLTRYLHGAREPQQIPGCA